MGFDVKLGHSHALEIPLSGKSLGRKLHSKANFSLFFLARYEIMCIFVAKFLINSMARSFIPFLTHCSKAPFVASEALGCASWGGGRSRLFFSRLQVLYDLL